MEKEINFLISALDLAIKESNIFNRIDIVKINDAIASLTVKMQKEKNDSEQ